MNPRKAPTNVAAAELFAQFWPAGGPWQVAEKPLGD